MSQSLSRTDAYFIEIRSTIRNMCWQTLSREKNRASGLVIIAMVAPVLTS